MVRIAADYSRASEAVSMRTTLHAVESRIHPQVVSLEQFFDALFQPSDGLIELRALPSKYRMFVRPGDVAAVQRFAKSHRHENVYFAVAARRDSSSGKTENCSVVRAVWVDLDFKDIAESEALRALADFPLEASLRVYSGGGIHAYWLLEEPFDLRQHAKEFKALLRRTARTLGADLGSAEPAHVLRIPGTFNFKYTPPREVHLV